MSFSPQTGLVYIPAQEIPGAYADIGDFEYEPTGWNTGADFSIATAPNDAATFKAMRAMLKGRLLAWDPVAQKPAWSVEHFGPWNGGVLSTAGGLVFEGASEAHFAAYDAASGERLWRFFTQTGVVAAPISYELDGVQYIAVAAGWGGAYGLLAGGIVPTGGEAKVGRVLVFRLGADGVLPALPDVAPSLPEPPPSTASTETIAAGERSFMRNCAVCHGDHAMSSGLVPNLRYSPLLGDAAGWGAVVREGARAELGMANFAAILEAEESEAIRAYVISEAASGRNESFYKTNAARGE
jgi:quinohemoprotein ethanol dehydrogenase